VRPESVQTSRISKERLRKIHCAASELRRGVPIIVDGDVPLLLIGAETASVDSLAEMEMISGMRPIMLMAPSQAAALLRTPVSLGLTAAAISLPTSCCPIELYQSMADPTILQPLTRPSLRLMPVPAGANAAIGLAKIGRLLPVLLASPISKTAILGKVGRGLITVPAADITEYPSLNVLTLKRITSVVVPLSGALDSRIVSFRSDGSALEHLAIVIGSPELHPAPLVRLHSECFTGDLLGSLRCDCGDQLRDAIRYISDAGTGVLLYLAQEGRGIGLLNKLRAYKLQDRGLDTMDANRALGWDADERDFLIGATMLRILGINSIRLLTNNPDKVTAMRMCGITVVERRAHLVDPNGVNDDYLATKVARFGHLLD
jgi:GTP cyclohydrolase II